MTIGPSSPKVCVAKNIAKEGHFGDFDQVKTTTKHQDFLFGRNLIQAAQGGAYDVTQLISAGRNGFLEYFK